MRTILVPLDGSVFAEQVLPSAKALATLLPARRHLVSNPVDGDHLYPPETIEALGETGWRPDAQPTIACLQATMRASMDAYLYSNK